MSYDAIVAATLLYCKLSCQDIQIQLRVNWPILTRAVLLNCLASC